jgi:hypothetical protein
MIARDVSSQDVSIPRINIIKTSGCQLSTNTGP